MHGERQRAAHAENGAERVGARPQMSDGTQVLEAVALLLQGVVAVGVAENLDLARLHLPALPLGRRLDHLPAHGETGAGADLRGRIETLHPLVEHDLQGSEAGTVVEGDKSHALAAAHRTHPAGDERLLRCLGSQDLPDGHSLFVPVFHGSLRSNRFRGQRSVIIA